MRRVGVLLAVLVVLVPTAAIASGPRRRISMAEARHAMRVVGNRLATEWEASGFTYHCYRRSSLLVRCSTFFYDTTTGDCSVRFNVTADRTQVHVREVGGEGNDDCPA
jgi:hypothetical protein